MSIRGILFDKDGTLFDYTATWMPLNHQAARLAARGDGALARELLVTGGWNPDTDTVAAGSLLAAHTNREIAEAWSRLLPDWSADALTDMLTEAFNAGGTHSAMPVTDLAVYFEQLHTLGYTIGVATSDSESGARGMLEHFKATHRIDFIAGYDTGHGTKPGPGMAQAFCRHSKLQSAEVVVVGDNYHDIEMGRQAGVGLTVGVLTGTSSRAELEAEADHVVQDITALPDLLQGLLTA